MDIKRFLDNANVFGIALSVAFGVQGYLLLPLLVFDNKKLFFCVLLLTINSLYCLFVEMQAIKRIGFETKFSLINNPLLTSFIVKFILLLGMALFLYFRLQLLTLVDCIIFSVLAYFFISGLFETQRLLRR